MSKKQVIIDAIMCGMGRATKPQTGWSIYQKIKRKFSVSGSDICIKMNSLCNDGKLIRVGYDFDGDSLYTLTNHKE